MKNKMMDIKKYVFWFSSTYTFLAILIFIALMYFDLDAISSSIVVIFTSAGVAVNIFIKDHNRLMTNKEILKLTALSWVLTLFITLIFLIFMLMWFIINGGNYSGLKSKILNLPIGLNALYGIIIFVIFLCLGVIYIGYRASNKMLSRIIK